MMVDVHMTDGRTVFRVKSRGNFIDLIGRKLSEMDSNRAISCWVRWHPQDDFVPCRIMSVRSNSVSFTREIVGEERQEFDAKFPPPAKREGELRTIKYVPIFVGKTENDERVVLYKNANNEGELHIERPDGKCCALSPGSEIQNDFDVVLNAFRVRIKSPEWTGTLTGTHRDLLEEEALR